MAQQKLVTVELMTQVCQLEVVADYTKLKQVVLNLVTNAIKYNKEGGNVKIACSQLEDNMVRIMVSDTGYGIEKKNHHRIFNAFDRLGQETSNIQGTGVGLVVTKNIVELMGGKIDFDRDQTEGATFWIDLPQIFKSEHHRIYQQQPYKLDQSCDKAEEDKKRILCVEDNPLNKRLMTAFMDKYPCFHVVHVTSAEAAWEELETSTYDLILMDINLPKMDGISLAQQIKALETPQSKLPIIAVSAGANAGLVDDTTGLFEAYVSKPVDFFELKEQIEKHIGQGG
jgi:CheY-like chemotaxis protein/anti-sigma regulatory factor (Ser/Thr protein kinase)